MRNQYMAKVLVHNKVVTEDQVNAHWDEITDQMDIGQVLVRSTVPISVRAMTTTTTIA